MNIKTDELKTKFQLRASGVDAEVVDDYRQVMAAEGWGSFPPIAVAEINGEHYVVDGHHRLAAAKLAQLEEVPCEVVAQEEEYALIGAFVRNSKQGLRFSRADKEHAVVVFLNTFGDRSDRWIADQLGVGHATVSRYRAKMQKPAVSNETPEPETRVGIDGKTYSVKPKQAEPEQEYDESSEPDDFDDLEEYQYPPEPKQKRENLSSADVLTLQKDLPVEVIGARLWVFYEGNSRPFKMSELAAFLNDRVLNGGE